MRLIGNIRLGRDAELRYTTDGKPVANLSGAWNYGMKGEDGNRPSQWAKLSLWGDRAESLEQYLKKGREFFVVVRDVHVETYQRRSDGSDGYNLVGTIESIDFTAGSSDRQGGEQQQRNPPGSAGPGNRAPAARAPAAASKPRTGTGFDDMDDDIPF